MSIQLPSVKIAFDNGALGTVIPMADGTAGLLSSAAAVTGTFALNTPYKMKGMRDVAKLGIDPALPANARLYKTLQEFYAQAGEGSVLWLMGKPQNETVSDWFALDPETGITPADDLLNAAKGEIRILFTSYSPAAPIDPATDLEDGLYEDVWLAATYADALAERFTQEKYAPFITLLEGYGFDGDVQNLKDLSGINCQRVALIIGDSRPMGTGTNPNYGAAIGIVAGKLAQNQVQMNIGRVADGALKTTAAYVLDEPAENFDFAELNAKSYIAFRYHQGKSGYYFIDDPMAADPTDDYYRITNRRVIDKAYRIVYDTLVNYLLDNIPVNADGTPMTAYLKAMEADVETAVAMQMTAGGELSADPADKDDKGVVCRIDPDQNVIATSRLEVAVRVRPYGYNRYIDVLLGFDIKA